MIFCGSGPAPRFSRALSHRFYLIRTKVLPACSIQRLSSNLVSCRGQSDFIVLRDTRKPKRIGVGRRSNAKHRHQFQRQCNRTTLFSLAFKSEDRRDVYGDDRLGTRDDRVSALAQTLSYPARSCAQLFAHLLKVIEVDRMPRVRTQMLRRFCVRSRYE